MFWKSSFPFMNDIIDYLTGCQVHFGNFPSDLFYKANHCGHVANRFKTILVKNFIADSSFTSYLYMQSRYLCFFTYTTWKYIGKNDSSIALNMLFCSRVCSCMFWLHLACCHFSEPPQNGIKSKTYRFL